MLFNILILIPFLPLFLAAPYNPFPPPIADLVSRSDHGRAGFTPAMLAAYRTAHSSETTPVARGLLGGRHYQRGVSMLQSRAVGQGRRSKVRIVKRQAKTCVPISSTATISTTSAIRTQLNTIKMPSLTMTPSRGPTSTSTSVSSTALSSSTSTTSSSAYPTATPSSSVLSSSSVTSSSAAVTSSASASPIPSSSSASPSPKPSPSAVTRITNDRNGDGPFSGWGTWYDVGLGACGVWDTPDHPIVAISAELMDNWPGISPGYNPNNHPLCGQHLKITWGGKSTIARVADRCPGCAVRSLDMSKSLFESFATLDVGLLGMDSYTGNITWSWVEGSGALPNLPYTP